MINEVAPPTAKHERMVKHIKKSYKKDGKLTDDEKSIAYATAWKNYNKEEVIPEAKVDKGKSDYAKQNERNQRTFGNRRGSRGSLASHDDTEARRYNTKKSRGVKMRGKKDKTPVNYHKKDSQARVDALLKSMKEEVVNEIAMKKDKKIPLG